MARRTSVTKPLTASSVCDEPGLLASSVLCLAVEGLDGGIEAKLEYGVASGSAFISSMNFTLPPVMNVWMWLFWNESIFLRYLFICQTFVVAMESRLRLMCDSNLLSTPADDLQIFGAPLCLFYHI